ncbi:MAG TPA: VOC family protein [Acidimicrobiia bacterium]|jgi:catechol 2,3-dioxygenase-like lactoylglutathione lyase family enzyme|nr:VOC family protein [Acidimicrobiia bacterium]
MRLSNVILRVADLGESVAFWRDLVGLDLSWSGDEFAFFAVGENQLTLNQPLVFENQASETEIVFEVEDVHSVISEMRERGVPFDVEPRSVTSDGERTLFAAHFRDPDGHVASITGWVEGA